MVGKPLPSNVYALITYIESNILEETTKKKINPQAEKAKVLRETKFIPKIVLCIENFNKHVILLAKKTNDRLANFLHFGTVRDFRIKTSDLKAAIDRTLSHSSQIETEDSNEDEQTTLGCEEAENEEEMLLRQIEEESEEVQAYDKEADPVETSKPNASDSESTTTTASRCSTPIATTSKQAQKKTQGNQKVSKEKEATKRKRNDNKEKDKEEKKSDRKSKEKKIVKESNKKKPSKAAKTIEIDSDIENEVLDDGETLDNESNRESCTQLLDNLAKINAKTAKKRLLRGSEPQDPDVLCAPPLEPEPKKRKRNRQKRGGK